MPSPRAPSCWNATASPRRCAPRTAGSPASAPRCWTTPDARPARRATSPPTSSSPRTETRRRTAVSLGIRKRDDRPLGVAVRTYFTSPRHDDDWMEGWLELPGRDGKLLPGYGWVFGVGDGTSNVGLGILNSSKEFGKLDYKQVLREWTAGMPAEWGFTPGEPGGRNPRRRAAHGLQPHPALLSGPAAPRRRRRHGLPVQRRGHLLRHGVRPLRGRVHHRRAPPGPRPPAGGRATRPPTRTLPGTRTTCGTSGAHTSPWDGRSPP